LISILIIYNENNSFFAYLNLSRDSFFSERMDSADIAIIGAGPAGMTAAIYALRKNLSVRLLEKKMAGGYTAVSVLIENYPGIKEVKGIELAMKIQDHLSSVGGTAEEGIEIVKAKKTENKFVLDLNNGKQIESKAVIIASGTTHKTLNTPNAEKFEGKGIHYCATCDGPMYKDKIVSVVGGGNSGVTNALFLADICKKVYLFEFSEAVRADEVYHEKLKTAGVEVITEAEVFEVLGEDKVSGLKYKNRKSGEEKSVESEAIFVYIGLIPNSGMAKELGCEIDDRGFVKVDQWMKTSVPGVLAAGDITGGFAQTIVACGQGAVAAESAYRHIKS